MFRYLFTVWVFFLEYLMQRKRNPPKVAQDFDAWFTEHKKTCAQCRTPPGPYCDDANQELAEVFDQLDLDVDPRDGKPIKR